MINQKYTWLDVCLGNFKWYRKLRKGNWYKHEFTKDAEELSFSQGNTWWTRHNKINRYSNVILTETYTQKIELTTDELFNLLKEAYRNGYSSYEMVDAGLEPYDADGYAKWVLLKLK